MKTIGKILGIVLCLTLVIGLFTVGASAAPASETLVASDLGGEYSHNDNFTGTTRTHFSLTNTNGKYYVHSTSGEITLRIYQGSTFTITPASGYKLVSVTIVDDGSKKFNDSTASISNGSTITDGSFTVTNGSLPVEISAVAQFRIVSMTVYYEEDSTPACTHTGMGTTVKYDGTDHWTICNGCQATVVAKTGHTFSAGQCTGCAFGNTNISAVLADATELKEFMITGKVVYISGTNAYLQDATGAMCAYFNYGTDLSSLSLGDWISVVGKYKVYNGLPELTGMAAWTTAAAGTAGSALTSLAGLDEGDICMPIQLTNLTVKAVDGSNVILTDGTNDITWYKPVVEGDATLGEGDQILTLNGVVSSYNGLQILNTQPATVQQHTHQYEWKADETGHWQACACGDTTDKCTTALTPKNDANDHWNECDADGCDYATTKAPHSFAGDFITNATATGHYQLCACGAKSADAPCADGDDTDKLCDKCGNDLSCDHSAGWDKKYDANKHWEQCKSCGTTKGDTPHTLTYGKTDTKHYQECACGYKSAEVDHEPAYKYDNNQHWTECVCGLTSAKEYHTLANGKCACGFEKDTTPGYYKVTTGTLTSGKYVLVVNNGYAPTKMDGTYLLSGQPTISGDKITNPEQFVIELIVEGDKVTMKDASGKVIINKANNNALQSDATEGAWTWEYKDGYFYFHDNQEEPRYLCFNSAVENRFRAYRENSSQADSQARAFTLYKLSTNASTGDDSVVSVAIAAAVLSVLGTAVLITKKKEF